MITQLQSDGSENCYGSHVAVQISSLVEELNRFEDVVQDPRDFTKFQPPCLSNRRPHIGALKLENQETGIVFKPVLASV